MRQHLGEVNALSFLARGQQGRNRRAEMPRIDFIKRKRAIRRGAKRAGVSAATGANGLQRRDIFAPFAQKLRQQRRQNRFADAGVRARDEDNPLHLPT